MVVAMLLAIWPATGAAADDTAGTLIEFLSGSKVTGRIAGRDGKYITFETTIGGRAFTRKYPLESILAITTGGKREVINQSAGSKVSPSKESPAAQTPASETPSTDGTRSQAEIEALVDRLGREQPDWWNSVPVNYPKTLDLSWPARPPGKWNAQRNVGQHLWEVVNPNPGRWKEGIRFVHHLLEMHSANSEKRTRAMSTLGTMYCDLLQDYARAAFWWQQAGVARSHDSPLAVKLAVCYWKLGNKQMAMDLIQKTPIYYSTIKLLADMGETDTALRYAESGARGSSPDMAYLCAGDACRVDGQYGRAIEYYQKVLTVPVQGKFFKVIQRNHTRARANIEGIRIFDSLDISRVPSGTYRAGSPGYAGDVQVEVTVSGGRIASVKVVSHKEKQFFSSITDTPRKIVEKQGVKGVDATTSATVTSEAIINATAKALAGAIR